MKIYDENNYKPDWNDIIKEYHRISTYVWSNNIQSRYFSRLEEKFIEKISRNAPSEAEKIIYELQEYEKANRLDILK